MIRKTFFLIASLLLIGGGNSWANQYPDVLYAVGNATSTGWNLGGDNILYKYADANKYQGFVSLTGTENGELKFLCQADDWGDMWGANNNGDGISAAGSYTIAYHSDGSPDYKFKPTISGLYLVTIDATGESATATFKQWNNSTDVYEIGNAAQLSAFANCINNFNQSVNAKLTANVDWGTTTIMIGGNKGDDTDYAQAYKGTFDGQGHTLTYSLSRTENYASLFKNLDGATIQNLKVAGSVTHHTNKCKYTASIFGKAWSSAVIKNCISTVNLTNYTNEDATMGGIGALMYDSGTIIQDCAFLGTLTGDWGGGKPYGVGGILGWAGNSGPVVKNCYVNGTISVADNDQNKVILRSNDISPINCYYINNGNLRDQTGATLINSPQQTSGEAAYKLNQESVVGGTWHQTIGSGDPLPMPFGSESDNVFAQLSSCNGSACTVSGYTNDVSAILITRANHSNVSDGQCSKCGTWVISSPSKLTAFATDYTNGDVMSKYATAYIDNNLDMSGQSFSGIGSDAMKFAGKLIGTNPVIISNLAIDKSEAVDHTDVGLIRVATNGARVKNMTMDCTCSFKGQSSVAAIIGTLNDGGDVYLENCGNEAPVTSTQYYAAGLVGKAWNSTVAHLTNCYNVGGVKSDYPANAASLTFETEGAVFTNCYSFLDAADSEGLIDNCWFTHSESYTIDNCYDSNTSLKDGMKTFTTAEMADGTLKGKLGDAYINTIYGANAHPGFAQQVTMKLAENDDNTMPASDLAGQHVILNRALVADNWNTICLPFDLGDLEVWFGAGTKAAEFSSELGGVLHFTLVTSLSANTPYLLYPTENKTSMTFSGITIKSGGASFSSPDPSNYTFRGIYSPTSITGNYFIASDNKIKRSTGGRLKAFRAYIESSETEAHELSFDFEDAGIATGISDATRLNDNGQMINDNYYDLSGRRVENPTRGLYIVNGKKVNIK